MAEGLNNKQSGDANIAFITLPGDMWWWWCYHVELIMKLLNPQSDLHRSSSLDCVSNRALAADSWPWQLGSDSWVVTAGGVRWARVQVQDWTGWPAGSTAAAAPPLSARPGSGRGGQGLAGAVPGSVWLRQPTQPHHSPALWRAEILPVETIKVRVLRAW